MFAYGFAKLANLPSPIMEAALGRLHNSGPVGPAHWPSGEYTDSLSKCRSIHVSFNIYGLFYGHLLAGPWNISISEIHMSGVLWRGLAASLRNHNVNRVWIKHATFLKIARAPIFVVETPIPGPRQYIGISQGSPLLCNLTHSDAPR